MRCPWCNNNNTVEVIFGERTPEIKQMEKWGHCVHASKLGVIPVSDDLQYCKDCKKVFSYKDYPPVDTDELAVYYATIRLQYLPEKIKYLILNEAPPTMYMGEAPAFFYSNPDNLDNNSLYEEVITTLFFPPEYVDKTRTIGLSIEKGFEYMNKYLKIFQAKGFFEIDVLEYPTTLITEENISKAKLNKLILKEMEIYKKFMLDNIKRLADEDTVIFLVKKSTYDMYYLELSKKYKIANDILLESYGTPYLSEPRGHQREFRQKFHHCLKALNYKFETDFSYIKYKEGL